MAETVYHMVHYREFSHDNAAQSSTTLENLVRSRLSAVGPHGVIRWESIEDRVLDLQDGSGMEIILNRVADLSSAVFGEMCLAHQNGVQALLNLTAKKHQTSTLTLAEVYSLLEQGAPEGSRYVRGLAYFLIIGNHIFFIRTQLLNPEGIEQYLRWLLTFGAGGMPMATTMSLESRFDKAALGGDIGDVKALRVSGPSFPQMQITPINKKQERERSTTKKIADKVIEFGQAFELASTLLGPANAKRLAESLGPKERLVVDATVRVRGTRTETSKSEMSNLAKQLDGLTEGKITIEAKDGKITDKDVILRTNMPFNADENGKSLLDFDNVADQLQKVYNRFVEDKKIVA